MKTLLLILTILFSVSVFAQDTTIVLDGSKSKDPEGKIVSYVWSQVSGPSVAITNANTSIARVKLKPGAYVFRLTGKDDKGLSAFKDKKININQLVILPITFSSFIVKQSGTVNTLTWKTSNEQDGLSMIVERSANQTSWTALADIAPKGTPTTYTYIDDGKGATQLYYRVKGIDLSREVTYTTTLSVKYIVPVPVKKCRKFLWWRWCD